MRLSSSLRGVVLASASVVIADDYNTFTNSVSHIQYSNIGGSGQYNAVSGLSGGWPNTCDYYEKSVSGSIAPFDEEVTFMVRAPIQLSEFAFYNKEGGSSNKLKRSSTFKNDTDDLEPVNVIENHAKAIEGETYLRHGHDHAVAHQRLHAKRSRVMKNAKREWITASNAEYGVFSWQTDIAAPTVNNFASIASSAASVFSSAASPASNPDSNTDPEAQSEPDSDGGSNAGPASNSNSNSEPPAWSSSGSWTRQAYYSSSNNQRTGLTFLTSQPLNDFTSNPANLLTSDTSFGIWSSNPCTSSSPCSFKNPQNTVNNHGFSGASKAFAFTFSMPPDQSPASGSSYPNAPALWLLNSAIPLVQEFGCSCRASGCGELDLFEAIYDPNSPDPKGLVNKLTSTLYGLGPNSIGSQSYFERPLSDSVKGVVVLEGGKATVGLLNNDVDVGQLTDADLEDVVTLGQTKGTNVRFP